MRHERLSLFWTPAWLPYTKLAKLENDALRKLDGWDERLERYRGQLLLVTPGDPAAEVLAEVIDAVQAIRTGVAVGTLTSPRVVRALSVLEKAHEMLVAAK